MKNLKGLKNNIASFENNKLENLSKINGGRREEETACSGNCVDKRTYHDNGCVSVAYYYW